jgi:hypothetical protein
MKIKAFLYVFLFLLGSGMAQAQVTFETKVSKMKLGINERLRVDFEMNKDGDNFNPPTFEGFRVVGGPNQAISNSFINGKRTYSKTYSYFLSPKSQGKFTIKQATIEIEGEIYKTLPIEITVTAAVTKPNGESDADNVASENVHLVAEISNTNPYLNEAITIVYKLYVSHEVSITRSWREIDSPKYADFWSQSIDNRGDSKIYEGTYQGKDYRYVILRRTVLYPQKIGKLEIEPLVLDVPIDVMSNRRDIFGRRLMTHVNKTISAGNRVINVKPLPQRGKPDNFTGAVGDFDFSVKANKEQMDANESLELEVKVTGKGNLKLFDLPSLSLPSSLEVYEPISDDNIRTNYDGMEGSVSETYTIIPQYKGSYPIRPISFSYFDVKTETYRTRASSEIIINVEKGPKPATSNTETDLGNTNKTAVLSKDQFKYIKLDSDLEPMNKNPFFRSKLYWWLLGTPFLLIPIFIFFVRKRDQRMNDLDARRLRMANKMARKYLSEAKKNIKQKEMFYESMERALHNYLKAKLDIETTEFSKERITELLLKNHVAKKMVEEFIELLKNCEFARYTPASNVTIQQDYNKAIEVISSIDKQIHK